MGIATINLPGRNSTLWPEVSSGEPTIDWGKGKTVFSIWGWGQVWLALWSGDIPGEVLVMRPCRVEPGLEHRRQMDRRGSWGRIWVCAVMRCDSLSLLLPLFWSLQASLFKYYRLVFARVWDIDEKVLSHIWVREAKRGAVPFVKPKHSRQE